MDITPHTHFLRSLRGDRIDYVILIGEGVDNAFDAGANSIEINISDDEIILSDDGSGITKDKVKALFRLGEHVGITTTQLGRFGMGIKSQAVNAGDILEIASVSADGRVRVGANWREVLKRDRWEIDDPRWFPVAVGTKTYAEIRIADLRKPPKVSLERIADELAQRFHPGLVEGRSIFLNGKPTTRLPEPAMTDVVATGIELSDGRSAILRAGILTTPSRLNRVHVAYRYRVIMPECSFGCGTYGGLSKMFARLTISGPWNLGKYKNDLTDEDERSELEEVTFAHLKPILEKVNSASMDARVQVMKDLINDSLPTEIAARPKRERETSDGPVRPPRPPGETKKPSDDKTGPAKSKKAPKNKLLVTFDGIVERDGIGAFEPGRPHRVNLSKDEPFIKRLLAIRDEKQARDSLRAVALMLFERGCEEHRLQRDLLEESFGRRVSLLLSGQDETTIIKDATA